ncbi:MalY/PatB family protein [Roseobacter sp.]|uniref:MalY/PatB family protein n=1 Tax=Roseobacter sp. TaxID=1907202 RepID=UPI00329A5D8D
MSLNTPHDARFDTQIDRRGTDCAKWDSMHDIFGVSPDTGLSMWVADMDFHPPACVQTALQGMIDHGIYGYYGDETSYRDAVQWWMQTRHGWKIEHDWIFNTHGLVNGTGMCIDTFTAPGDGVVLFTPVYHAFARVITQAGRKVVECPLAQTDGRYTMDFDAYDAQMTGSEKMVILCSPHNPGGRVWTRDELQQVADFAQRHDLILVSDEIHHDLAMPGHTHTPAALIDGVTDRLVMMTATSKTFNLAGHHTGNVIIQDPDLRAQFARRMAALGMSPNSFGLVMARAVYTPDGAAWVDDLIQYIDGNRQLFDAQIKAIPGLQSMALESTYLSWVDFSGTGMAQDEVIRRIQQDAQIAANHGTSFGGGGEPFMRFNIGTQRARVEDACARLAKAFGDLQ